MKKLTPKTKARIGAFMAALAVAASITRLIGEVNRATASKEE